MKHHLIPKPLIEFASKRQTDSLKVFVKKLNIFGNLDCQEVYSRLYKDKKYAFFLDSAKIHNDRGRFSFLGCADGPLAYSVSYKVGSREVKTFKSGEDRAIHFPLESENSFFKWISQKITDSKVDPSEIEFENCPYVSFDFFGGYVGNFGYEMKQECYPETDFKFKTASCMSDVSLLFIDRFIAVDHIEECTYLVFLQNPNTNQSNNIVWLEKTEMDINKCLKASFTVDESNTPILNQSKKAFLDITSHHGSNEYMNNIRDCLHLITDGESYELCLTTQFSSKVDLAKTSPWDFYKSLRHNNPAPYGAYFAFSDYVLACSSPELFMKVDSKSQVIMKPIKGTFPREPLLEGQDYADWLKVDLAGKEALSTSEKDLAENLMVHS